MVTLPEFPELDRMCALNWYRGSVVSAGIKRLIVLGDNRCHYTYWRLSVYLFRMLHESKTCHFSWKRASYSSQGKMLDTVSKDILEGAQISWIRLNFLDVLSLFRVSWCGIQFLVLYSGSSSLEFCPGRPQIRVFCPSIIMVFRAVHYYNWEFLWVFSVSLEAFSTITLE